jgi:hypothetical protein
MIKAAKSDEDVPFQFSRHLTQPGFLERISEAQREIARKMAICNDCKIEQHKDYMEVIETKGGLGEEYYCTTCMIDDLQKLPIMKNIKAS